MLFRLMSAVLAAALFLSLTTPALASEETLPPETIPAETVPQETVPETTAPPETVSETTAAPETVPETTAAAETIPETTTPAETVPAETVPEALPPQLLPISQAKAMTEGTAGITVRGTVVWAKGCQAVLQDDSGGIRLYFSQDPATRPGEVLQVTGSRGSGLTVADFSSLGTGELPLVKTTLAQAPQALRVQVVAKLTEGPRLAREDTEIQLSGETSLAAGTWVLAKGVILDGIFYADSLTRTDAPVEEGPVRHFFGKLHSHPGLMDGRTIPEAYAQAKAAGMDFFAVTAYSSMLDNAYVGSIREGNPALSKDWAAGRLAAEEATGADFLALFGYEMNWKPEADFGHISTFFTSGWQVWDQPAYEKTPENYYDTLQEEAGQVSIFCHPDPYLGTFDRFGNYTPARDRQMHLIELGTGEDPLEYYDLALQKGWHLAPSWAAEDGPGWTVVLAEALSEESFSEALRNYRAYATRDADLKLTYTVNGSPMGSILGLPRQLKAALAVEDPTNRETLTVTVVTEAGPLEPNQLQGSYMTFDLPLGHQWYYLKLFRNGSLIAVTAPVWVDYYEQMGIRSFTAADPHPIEGTETMLTARIYNDESVDLRLDKVEFFWGEERLHLDEAVRYVPVGGYVDYTWPLFREEMGSYDITVKLTCTVAGQVREYQQTLTVAFQRKELPLTDIGELKLGLPETGFRVRGYVTAGRENIYNRFENTLYLQDDTGGIQVKGSFASDPLTQEPLPGCFPEDLQTGRPMEIWGVLRLEKGLRVLEMTQYSLLDTNFYRYEAKALSCAEAMDYDFYGGTLVQVQGKVVSLEKTPGGLGLSRITVEDSRGALATAVIDATIGSRAYGGNNLAAQIKKGRTARIAGLVHLDEAGNPVLRVRNCDEVLYVPAKADPTNPKTGDPFWQWLAELWEKLW